MTNAERFNHWLKESSEPFNAIWRYCQGHWKRFRSAANWSAAHRKRGVESRKQAKHRFMDAVADIGRLRDEANELHDEIQHIDKEIEQETNEDRVTRLRERRQEKVADLERLRSKVDTNVKERRKADRDVKDAKERMRFWAKKRTVYRKKWREIKKRRQQNQAPTYGDWMLNGHSSNIDEDLKPVVAFVVAERHQTITDTYDYGGHVTSSLHYPRNNSDGQGHAVDWAGADMCGAMTALVAKFGQGKFLEQFGPCYWYLKYGTRYSGMFPGHGDHGHSAVA